MAEYRSKSCGDGRMEIENYYGGGGPNGLGRNLSSNANGELGCYSASYAPSADTHQQQQAPVPRELTKGKSSNGSISSKAAWCFTDPELQRKKRVASYKAYTVEGKIKRSFSKSFRWLKDRYTHMVHGW